jgi:hypothetical protein
MPSRSAGHLPIEKLLRELAPRAELVQRLALLECAYWLSSDPAFGARIEDLRLHLQPTPDDAQRILVEAAVIEKRMRELADD